MRKKISAVDETVSPKSIVNKKILNDIMFYLRKLIKLARHAQSISIKEGIEIDSHILDEFEQLKKEIDSLEESFK